jgi:hypothetical protein
MKTYRYFHVKEWEDNTPCIIHEYFGDFGLWIYHNSLWRINCMVKGQEWLISASRPYFGDKTLLCEAIALCLISMQVVNLSEASNLLSMRKKAMPKKQKK